jgi:hypothetical protein
MSSPKKENQSLPLIFADAIDQNAVAGRFEPLARASVFVINGAGTSKESL